MYRELAKVDEILPGGMKAFTVDGKEIVVCNDNGTFFAFERRCGHMSAPLDMGTANGYIVTCPLHSAQFDMRDGKALSGIIPAYSSEMAVPATRDNFANWIGVLMQHVKVNDIRSFPIKVEGNTISVDL